MAGTALVVIASAVVPVSREIVYAGFIDATIYSPWLRVPVSRDEGHFACTLEWGTQVRGTYEQVLPPSLMAMRWNFDDERIPLPGDQLITYLRVDDAPGGARVEVHQLVDTPEQASFMYAAWTSILGRLEQGLIEAIRL